ncbi:aromatic/alkene monooxygenase hydroxylase subunit beta [Roseateles saccharophilus]|uniref:Phenol 2-monooxygenase P1 subunit n=1 Tax=Roseateles saccharophilus TaxID=304 RepID=A0A4R3UKC7_ROSSA|nr:aromatic/alkene monooxygenase hydroxylase subunit beta [Roseateles saccharophilus]MDG0833969.1 phenol hydroxylase [Roseateles saccharophilus]TCU91087.1 phenol 2-monooxygenase P1 subunit [Roseateles saccharophilus]
MQVDIKTTDIQPIRQTFSHIARRLGADKAASRYQEATFDMQPTTNWHYRPLWEPDRHVYDPRRTAIVMADWYVFKDPRHFYYGVYTMARAKQQEGTDKQFEFAEKRNLLGNVDEATRESLTQVLVPLRHYEWGGNMNNTYCCGYGYGTAVTQACNFAAMDRLGIAQYLSRIGLLLDLNQGAALDAGRQAWLAEPAWQGVRRVMENLFVTRDWFELFVAQNLVFDGLLYPLIYRHYVDALSPRTGNALAMLTEFMGDWYAETARWVDATVKTAADESPANKDRLVSWIAGWRDEVQRALDPLARLALGDQAPAALAAVRAEFDTRIQRMGLQA